LAQPCTYREAVLVMDVVALGEWVAPQQQPHTHVSPVFFWSQSRITNGIMAPLHDGASDSLQQHICTS